MNIIDSHHHIWIPEQTQPDLGYGWLRDIGSIKPFGDPTAIQRDYTWSEYAAESKQHRLLGSVFLQCDGTLSDPVAETAWVQSVVELPAEQFAIVGLVNLAGDQAQAHLDAHCAFESFRGVRQIISYLDDQPQLCFSSEHLLRNARWRDQFTLLSEKGLSFDLQLYPEQMSAAADFLSHHPSVPVVVDHAGSPYDRSDTGLALWQSGLAQLSQLDNVMIKLSGFGMFEANWSVRSTASLIETIMQNFGPERVMFGSNFPVDKLMASYDETVNRVVECVKPAGDAAICDVFENTARRFYNLPAA